MSLLIKALEQAARDRDSAKAASAATSSSPSAAALSSASMEPTLEPAPPARSPRSVETSTASTTTASSDSPASPLRSTASLSLDAPAAQRRTTPTTAALAQIDAQQQRARAATVMQAAGQSSHLFARLRGHPVMLFGTLAVLFGMGFGIYVYLQIAQPGLFVREAATRPQNSVPQPPAPPVAQTAPADTAVANAPTPGAAMTSAPGMSVATVEPPVAAASAASAGSVGAPLYSGGPAPISAASVIASTRPVEAAREPAMEREPTLGRDQASRSTSEAHKAAAAPRPGPAEPSSSGRERVAVRATATQPRVSPALSQAYTALQAGNIEEARAMYSNLSQSEPLNIDALLGSAYIAAQENRSDDAMKLYLRILQINPRHASAQAALIGLMGRADPVASESRLKQLIAREPAAFLHFVLGNLYGDQSLWAPAQQAYFQAHHLEPDNPDYAYNLAISLDHLRQSKLAIGFYRRAEQLAAAQGRSNFNPTHARERISSLSSQLE